jgi:quinol monooxygenase YgiN
MAADVQQHATARHNPRFKENTMAKNARFVRFKTKPGKRDEVRGVWEKYARGYIAGSSGMLGFYYCYDESDPDAVIVFQLAADEASAQEFAKQPWFADYQRETVALVAGPAEIWSGMPQWVKDGAA